MTSTYHPSTRVSTDIATNSSALGMNQRYLQIGRTLLLVYAVLWVIEGALRKWVFLSLSDALLIIRDPVVISIYYVTYKAHCFPKNILSNLFTGLGVVLLVVGLLLQPEFPVTILYGFRVDFLYMPLIFVVPKLWNSKDVLRLGRWALIVSIPMVVLMVLQFLQPPDSLWNVGAGGGIGGQISTARGHIRPPGTFSYILGPVCLYSLTLAFLINSQFARKQHDSIITGAGTIAFIIAVLVSGSRTMIANPAIIISTGLIFGAIKMPHRIWRLVTAICLGASFVILATQIDFVQDGVLTIGERLQGTKVSQGGSAGFFTERTVGDIEMAFDLWNDAPLWGYGMGTGTSGGAKAMTGKVGLNFGEGDWSRIVLELGPFFGMAYQLLRASVLTVLMYASFSSLIKQSNILPLLLTAVCASDIFQGNLGVPVVQGFACFCAGLALAACRLPQNDPAQLICSSGGTP